MKNEYYSSKKRFLAIILSLMMIFQMLPAGALADDNSIQSNSASPKIWITFKNTTGEQVGPRIEVEQEAPIGVAAPAAPEVEGQEFIGWYSGETAFSADIVPTSDMVFTPRYGWIVRFRNNDGEIISTRTVENNTAIGELPATIAKEDYVAYWAIGTEKGGEQGGWTPGERISASFVVTKALDIVPDYDKVTRTVTFYTSADKTEVVTTKTVNVDTSYCLNDIPAVPAQSGSHGKWVYSGGDFGNNVAITENTDVWPVYEQTVFTVTYMVDGEEYQKDTYYTGDTLTLPTEPVVEGKDFNGWYAGETAYVGGETITSDLTLNASFEKQYLSVPKNCG